tara:strand:- start:566 stop:919 length:354 start_codon:yes stop_codon:yes gene_type:complete
MFTHVRAALVAAITAAALLLSVALPASAWDLTPKDVEDAGEFASRDCGTETGLVCVRAPKKPVTFEEFLDDNKLLFRERTFAWFVSKNNLPRWTTVKSETTGSMSYAVGYLEEIVSR